MPGKRRVHLVRVDDSVSVGRNNALDRDFPQERIGGLVGQIPSLNIYVVVCRVVQFHPTLRKFIVLVDYRIHVVGHNLIDDYTPASGMHGA